jgi:hypothetical protein
VYWIVPKVDKESGNIINNENWLASAMDVIGSGRDDKDQYLILRWLAFGSDVPTTAAIPLADIGEREGWRALKAGGVKVTAKSNMRAIWPTGYSATAHVSYGVLPMPLAGSAGHISCPTEKSSAHLPGLCYSAVAAPQVQVMPYRVQLRVGVAVWRVWHTATMQ